MNRRIFALLPVVTFACAANSAPSSRANGSGGNTGDGVGGSGIITNTGGSGPVIPGCSKDCTDFQTAVIFDGAATADVATKFGDPSTGGPAAACIIEPAPGSMVPRNWWRPRVHFTAQPGEALFEIRVHADIEKNDLVVYTSNTTYLLPVDAWKGVAAHSQSLTVTVRGMSGAGGAISKASSVLNIAPVDAGGAMVYWGTTSVEESTTTSKLIGLQVGQEGTVDALHVDDVKEADLFNEQGLIKPSPPVTSAAATMAT